MSKEQDRVNRLVAALTKLEKKLEKEPNGPRKSRMKARCSEYRKSLVTFRKYGRERVAPKKVGVKISVPLGQFGLEGKALEEM